MTLSDRHPPADERAGYAPDHDGAHVTGSAAGVDLFASRVPMIIGIGEWLLRSDGRFIIEIPYVRPRSRISGEAAQ
jgi:hypothetical protein